MGSVTNDWLPVVEEETKKEYYKKLYTFLKDEYSHHIVYPKSDDIFNALHLTPLSEVKVVILGQDPKGCLFQYQRERKYPHHFKIYTRSYRLSLALTYLKQALLESGRSRGYCSLILY